MLPDCLDEIVSRYQASLAGRTELAEAREAFEQRTGRFREQDPWYEERVQAFLDWFVCEWKGDDGLRPVDRRLQKAEDPDARELWLALACSKRSLFRAAHGKKRIALQELFGGMEFTVELPSLLTERFSHGDVFDGRLTYRNGLVEVLPGAIFHPAQVRNEVTELARRAHSEQQPRHKVLDALLRMRSRVDHHPRIRPQSIYRYEALEAEQENALWGELGKQSLRRSRPSTSSR